MGGGQEENESEQHIWEDLTANEKSNNGPGLRPRGHQLPTVFGVEAPLPGLSRCFGSPSPRLRCTALHLACKDECQPCAWPGGGARAGSAG